MRYIGRHRAPRPLYLRRPVIGGVAAALVVGGPALALTAPGGGSPAPPRTQPSRTSSATPDTLVPTDAPLPSDSPSSTTRTTSPGLRTTTTSRPAYPATTSTSRSTTSTTKPHTSTKTTTKPPTSTYKKISVTGVTLAASTVASGGAVSGTVSYTGGKSPYTYSVNQPC